MKKLLILLAVLLSVVTISYSQDTVRIKHTNYTTVYSKSLKYPVLVEWYATKAKVACANPLPRKDQFAPDPLLPSETNLAKDYIGSGTDRGHMCPAADNECSGPKVLTECFYFSNMAPQYHSLNAGDWKSVETLCRDLASKNDSVHIWAGSIGVAKTLGADKVAVPTECWKVIYVVKTKEWLAFEFKNTTDKPTGVHSHQVTVKDIEKLTGFKFN
jgi:endonuclease G